MANRWWPWIVLLAAAFTVRLAAAVWWQSRLPADRPFVFGDSESYWFLGQAIAEGRPFAFGGPDLKVFRTPGYPLILAAVMRLAGADHSAVLPARCVGAVLGTVCVGLTVWWARSLFGPSIAWWSGWLIVAYPGAVVMSVLVLSEAAFCPAMLGQLACWTRAAASRSRAESGLWSVGTGICAGLAALCRPSWLLFLPFAGVVSLIGGSRRRGIEWGLALVACAAVMAPWWWRNYREIGRFVPTTLQVGASLYDGWNPRADGASRMDFVPSFTRDLANERGVRPDASRTPFEVELDRRMAGAAIDWARRHPRRVVELAWIKAGRMWSPWPNDERFGSFGLRSLVALTYVPLVAGACIGLWRFASRGWPVTLCLLPAVYLTLLHIVFVSSLRYREPAMFGLAILATAGAAGRTGPAESREPPCPTLTS
ncbi:MAG: glycosyltransferase family 39 protein [Planctomycetes bacterium]|nr:glycosyltransferase family 39 protein [Planctomycetota bacterium]